MTALTFTSFWFESLQLCLARRLTLHPTIFFYYYDFVVAKSPNMALQLGKQVGIELAYNFAGLALQFCNNIILTE